MDIPLIEQVKIQAQVLVPLVKALQADLGEERANDIVRGALGDLYRTYGDRWSRAYELGFLLTCGADFAHAEGLGTGVKLTRTQTIMQGASHCDFRYARQPTENDG